MALQLAHRFRLTIAYVVLVIAVVIALALSYNNQQDIQAQADEIEAQAERDANRSAANQKRIEQQSARASRENCESINESKDVIHDIIAALISDPERRAVIFERIDPFLVHNECPPVPVAGVIEDQREGDDGS